MAQLRTETIARAKLHGHGTRHKDNEVHGQRSLRHSMSARGEKEWTTLFRSSSSLLHKPKYKTALCQYSRRELVNFPSSSLYCDLSSLLQRAPEPVPVLEKIVAIVECCLAPQLTQPRLNAFSPARRLSTPLYGIANRG